MITGYTARGRAGDGRRGPERIPSEVAYMNMNAMLGAGVVVAMLGGAGGGYALTRATTDEEAGSMSRLARVEQTAAMNDIVAKLGMATGALWMSEHHLHEVEEALEHSPPDWEEAHEEAAELVPWLKGTAWPQEVQPIASQFVTGVRKLVAEIEIKNPKAAKEAFAEAKKKYKHLHHEIMEMVEHGITPQQMSMAKSGDGGHGSH
jgi:hypothetical protein